MCPLSFWYQLQTCEITLLQEVSSYLPTNGAWDGPLGILFKSFFKAGRLQNLPILILNRIWPPNHDIGIWYRWIAACASSMEVGCWQIAK
jgi:hypothetical protein